MKLENQVNLSSPKALLLSLAIAGVIAGCNRQDADTTAAGTDTAAADTARFTLDETNLPPVNRFTQSDLDPAVDACTDFGGHVNGKWLAANDIPGDRTSWGAFEMLDERSKAVQRQLAEQAAALEDASGVEKIVGDLWATGMNAEAINAAGITPIKGHLDAIAALDSSEAVAEYLRTSAAKGQNFLFGFGPEADFKDSANNIAYAMQGGLGLPDKTYYTDADKADKLAAYEKHIAKVLEMSGVPAADAATQASNVIAFEKRLAGVSKSQEEMSRDVSLYYNPVTPAEADTLTPNFSWTRFFDSQGVEAPEMFSLAMPDFHAEVSEMLEDVPVEQWQSYLRFHTVDGASPYLSDEFVQANYEFYGKTMRGQKELKERGKRVLDTIESQAGEALGQMYVDVAFPADSKAKMQELVKNLSAALKPRIENLEWMSDETKAKAMAKWETFTPKIGYPDKWREWTGLSTDRDSYIENVLAAQEFNYKWQLSKIGEPVDKTEWGMSPQTVNAYYNPLQNEIVFPAAILQPPFFDPKADPALNYGGIGAVIGHEMLHGYDDQGSQFDAEGNFANWWQDADRKGFESRTDKLVQQFDDYESIDGLHVKGELTLGENIADLGGLTVAYDAYRKALADAGTDPAAQVEGYTRFFANWATVWRRNFTDEELNVRLATDPHAPANFRAMGAPINLPAFAAAYECEAGDAMVRGGDDQVVIW